MKEVLGYVASGGGAWGAWGGGVSEHLVKDMGKRYTYLSGTSTGALLMNLVALGEMDLLKTAYTSVNNKDIYTVNPFVVKKNGKVGMNFFNIIRNVVFRGQKTFGDTTRLRERIIPKFFKEEDYTKLLAGNIELMACVTNITTGSTELKSNFDSNFDDFLDWIWASTCAVPFMTLVQKDGVSYADGGYIEDAPIQCLIDKGCTSIDVILHKPVDLEKIEINNVLDVIGRIIETTMHESATLDLKLAELKAGSSDVTLNIYRVPKYLSSQSLVFDKEQMLGWWQEGYEFAKADCHECYILKTSGTIKKI